MGLDFKDEKENMELEQQQLVNISSMRLLLWEEEAPENVVPVDKCLCLFRITIDEEYKPNEEKEKQVLTKSLSKIVTLSLTLLGDPGFHETLFNTLSSDPDMIIIHPMAIRIIARRVFSYTHTLFRFHKVYNSSSTEAKGTLVFLVDVSVLEKFYKKNEITERRQCAGVIIEGENEYFPYELDDENSFGFYPGENFFNDLLSVETGENFFNNLPYVENDLDHSLDIDITRGIMDESFEDENIEDYVNISLSEAYVENYSNNLPSIVNVENDNGYINIRLSVESYFNNLPSVENHLDHLLDITQGIENEAFGSENNEDFFNSNLRPNENNITQGTGNGAFEPENDEFFNNFRPVENIITQNESFEPENDEEFHNNLDPVENVITQGTENEAFEPENDFFNNLSPVENNITQGMVEFSDSRIGQNYYNNDNDVPPGQNNLNHLLCTRTVNNFANVNVDDLDKVDSDTILSILRSKHGILQTNNGNINGERKSLSQVEVGFKTVDHRNAEFKFNEDSCAICYESLSSEYKVVEILHCGHQFHKLCLFNWIRQRQVCPYCRATTLVSVEVII